MSRGGMSFSEDQIAEFQEAFLLYDNRGDGKIAVSLIGDVMRALGQNPTESEVKKLVHEHRADERVSFETFLPIFQVRFVTYFISWPCYVFSQPFPHGSKKSYGFKWAFYVPSF